MLHQPAAVAPSNHMIHPNLACRIGRAVMAVCRRGKVTLRPIGPCLCLAVCFLGSETCTRAQVWDGGAGTTNWQDANNWSPNGAPAVGDSPVLDASLVSPLTVSLSANVFDIFGLTISDGYVLDMNGSALFVNDTLLTAQTEITGAGSALIVDTNAAFDTDLLLVRANGQLTMRGGSTQVDAMAEIRANGSISGDGDVIFGNNTSTGILLDNKGNISVSRALNSPSGGTLTISKWGPAPAGATLSLSGSSGSGTLTVNDNSLPILDQTSLRLVVDGETEAFAGVLDIGRADTAEFVNDLDLVGGRIELNGSGGTATLTGTGIIGGLGGQISVLSGTGRIENVVGMGTASIVDVAAASTLVLANTFTAGSSATVNVGDNATIQFDGTGNVLDGPPVSAFALGNNAKLRVNGDLTMDGGTTFGFDWDGASDTADAEVRGDTARLSIIASSLADAHDSDLTIADGGRVEVALNGVSWHKNGNLILSSNAGGPNTRLETQNNGRAVFKGNVTAGGDGTSVIDGEDNQFDAMTTVRVDPAATLRLRNAEIEDGTIWGDGNGTLQFSNQMIVNGTGLPAAATTMNFQTVDLDGPGGEIDIALHAPLLLQAENINDEAGNVFGQFGGAATAATMLIRPDGRLDVSATHLADPQWILGENAIMTLLASPLGSTQVTGTRVQVSGTVDVIAGASRWDARAKIDSTGRINLAAGTSLQLRGGTLASPNLIEGGIVAGGGQLRSGSSTGLHGFGTVSADVNFSGVDRELMAAGGTLNVNGPVIDVGRIGTADASGTLQFGQGFSTQIAQDALVLNGGNVTGAAINNTGTTRGFGTIKSSQFLQATAAGTLSATSGNLTIDVLQPTAQVAQGTLNAIDGDLFFMQPLSSTFDGTVNVGLARRVEFQGGWNLSNGGQLNFNGGTGADEATVVGETLISGGATVNVTNTGVFRDQVTFATMAQVNLPAATNVLLLEGNAVIPFLGASTAIFTGNGVVANQVGSQLMIESDVTSIGVDLNNRGTLEIEPGGPGNVSLGADFVQFFSGTTHLDIGGHTPGVDHDRLAVSGTATLDGAFAVTLLGGFVPVAGDTFDVIDFASASGAPAFVLPTLSSGLVWDTSQFVSAGKLAVTTSSLNCDFDGNTICDLVDLNSLLSEGPVAPGVTVTAGVNDQFDLNADSVIDNADVDIWLADAGAANGLASAYKRGDGNLDGVVDGQDFILWNGSKFTSSLRWDDGEFTGDGVVDGQDFITWNANKFTSSDGLSVVPEPRLYCLLTLTLIIVHQRGRQAALACRPTQSSK